LYAILFVSSYHSVPLPFAFLTLHSFLRKLPWIFRVTLPLSPTLSDPPSPFHSLLLEVGHQFPSAIVPGRKVGGLPLPLSRDYAGSPSVSPPIPVQFLAEIYGPVAFSLFPPSLSVMKSFRFQAIDFHKRKLPDG